jgi:hypothetical protein
MITVDNILLEIINSTSPTVEEVIAIKDSRVLRSLGTSVTNHNFITENQSKLLLRIFRENTEKLSKISENLNSCLRDPFWSKPFRQIEQVKKFYIGKNDNQDSLLFIEFTFSSEIRKILTNLSKNVENLTMTANGKIYTADLTEKNIAILFEALTPYGFTIDEAIKTHYETIKSWSKNEVERQFLLSNIEYKNFQKAITEDLGIETPIDQSIITDRSMRYQYHLETPRNFGENLTENLANRTRPRTYVDKNQHSMVEIFNSLIQLKRLPTLVVFDTLVNNKYFDNLQILSESLEKNGIFDHIGIYFRLPNDDNGKKFNQYISEKKYNHVLDDTTKIACVQSGKLPKFFLKNAWRPMSVIALDSRMGLRHGKTAVYSNYCDLIVEWSDEPALADTRIKV